MHKLFSNKQLLYLKEITCRASLKELQIFELGAIYFRFMAKFFTHSIQHVSTSIQSVSCISWIVKFQKI